MHPRLDLIGINHVSLLAPDLERTVQFYVDVLGLRIIGSDLAPPAAANRVWLGDDRGPYLTITRSSDSQPGELGIGTIHHISLSVESRDALLKWKRWLQHKGVLVYGPYDQQAYQDLVFADPDGVRLEIATCGPGFRATEDGTDIYTPPLASMAPFRDEDQIRAENWPAPVTAIEPDMPLQGLHHVATITSSLERSDSFYREVLGLELVRKTIDSDDPDVEHWYWGLDAGRPGTLVTAFPIVHPHEGGKAVYGRTGPGVPLRYALAVSTPEALPDWVTSLSATGIEVAPVVSDAGVPAVTVHDPDGEGIEIVTAHPGRVPRAGRVST